MAKYNDETLKTFLIANKVASNNGGVIGSEHLLAAIAYQEQSSVTRLMVECGLNLTRLMKEFNPLDENQEGSYDMTERAANLLRRAESTATRHCGGEISPEIIIMMICMDSQSVAVKLLLYCDCRVSELRAKTAKLIVKEKQIGKTINLSINDDIKKNNANKSAQKMPVELDGLGFDMSLKAEIGKLDPVIGRADEVDRIIQILSRRSKNNPVLIGEAGVGKTAIIEGLVQAIHDENVPEMLIGKRIFCLDLASMVAGTKYRGEYEERLNNAIKVIKEAGNIIVFVDEIHMIVNNGSSEDNYNVMANIIKPPLARGEMTIIGATTPNEYRNIEKDSALERRFQTITVNPPSVEDTIAILKGIRDNYENHHKVKISDNAIIAAAGLSDRYISDRNLPDKAIDLVDEACSRKRISALGTPPKLRAMEDKLKKLREEENYAVKVKEFLKAQSIKEEMDSIEEEYNIEIENYDENRSKIAMSIGSEDIAAILSSWTGVPVEKITQLESEKLMALEKTLHERVVGQDDAVISVARAVRRGRAGLKDPKRPIGSFIFLGPTGVGKTELSKALAEAMFGDEKHIIRVDMSEYMDKHDVSKLIGTAPGLVGYEDGGQLSEKVRRKPYSVVLFDEIEKAHPDIFNILLQILEDGRLTDSHGRVVSFKNTIIIMTSNIGASEISGMSRLGFGQSSGADDYEAMRCKQMDALKKAMRPEFINRIDDIIIFRTLDELALRAIAVIMLDQLKERLVESNISISYDENVVDYIVSIGSDKEYGARPLRRAIQRVIEDRLSEDIIEGRIAENDSVAMSVNDGAIVFESCKK